MSGERLVKVWDKPYTITVAQQSKSVWVATGHYMGDWLETKRRTEQAAIRAWCDAARYKGNDLAPS